MKRRAKGEGTLKRTASGKWRVVKRINGKSLSTSSYKSKIEAIEAAKSLGTQAKTKITLKQYWSRILYPKSESEPSQLMLELSASSWSLYDLVYRTCVEHWEEANHSMHKLTHTDIRIWRDAILTHASKSTANRYLQILHAVLERARKEKLITENPASNLAKFSIPEHEKRILAPQEISHFLALFKTCPRIYLAILLLLHGLRTSEACGLKKSDFDGTGITVRRAAIEVAGKLIINESTKTGKVRYVPVTPELAQLLSQAPEGFVLQSSNGNPLRRRNLSRSFRKIIAGTPFEKMSLHDLRSTFGMLLLESGADVRTAAEITGHSPSMLAKAYARSRRSLKIDAVIRAFEMTKINEIA